MMSSMKNDSESRCISIGIAALQAFRKKSIESFRGVYTNAWYQYVGGFNSYCMKLFSLRFPSLALSRCAFTFTFTCTFTFTSTLDATDHHHHT